MRKQLNRRRIKKRRRPNENSKMKFTAVLVIMLVAVALGYLTARCVIGPLLGYDADESPIQIAGKQSEAGSEDDLSKHKDESSRDDSSKNVGKEQAGASENTGSSGDNSKDAEDSELDAVPSSGYALQFGVFSTKEAAQKMVDELTQKGVETKIIKDGESFKVISPIINTKEEAIGKIDEIKDKEVADVFIASF